MKYLTDKEIAALSDEEKFNRLNLCDFERVAEDVCENCYRMEDCDGYFSSSCPCYGYWSDILTNLLRAEQDLKMAIDHIQNYEPEDGIKDQFPLSTLGFYEGHLCSVPYYG